METLKDLPMSYTWVCGNALSIASLKPAQPVWKKSDRGHVHHFPGLP